MCSWCHLPASSSRQGLWPALAPWVFAPLAVLLSGLHALVQGVAALPGAQIHVAAPSALMLIAYYGLLGRVLSASRRRSCRLWAGVWSVLLLAGIAWQYIEARPQHLRITFLDVGTGDAILVQAPGNHTLLIDGGGTYDGRFDIGTNVVAPVLWQRYIRRFDLMALTHMHPNHARGLERLFQRFPTRHLLTNGSPLQGGYLQELATTAAQRGTPIHTAQTGPRQWQWGQLQLTVLSPPAALPGRDPDWQPPTENDRSLVLRLQYGAFRILLTGDIQHATERWLLTQDIDLQADILQVPHHGSRTSTSPAFVQRVQPQVGIISAGAGNPYGHPHARVLDVLEKQHVRVFRTDRHGAVTIISDGTSYRVRPFRAEPSPLHRQGP